MSEERKAPQVRDDAEEEAEVQALAQRVVLGLVGGEHAVHVYDPENSAVTKIATDLVAALVASAERFGEGAAVQVKGDNFFVNKNLVKMDYKTFNRALALKELFKKLDITEIQFPVRPDIKAVKEFLVAILNAQRDDRARVALFAGPIGGVAVRKVKATFKTSTEVEKERLCVKLTCILKAIMMDCGGDGLDERRVLRVRRIVQLLIDGAPGSEGALYSVAMAPADGTPADHLVRVTVFAVLFGRHAGLGKVAQFHVAMAALFHDIGRLLSGRPGAAADAGPLLAVKGILGAGGVGEDLLSRAVACFEYGTGLGSYRHRDGHSLATRVVAVVDAYVTAVEGGALPAETVQAMIGARDRFDQKMLSTFLRFVGPHPIASVVELSNGEVAVVSGRPAGRERISAPEVMVVIDATRRRLPQPRALDLAATPGVKIVRALAPDKAGVDPLEVLAS